MRQTLRPYQEAALRNVLAAFREGARRVLLVLPTGGGKTSVFTELVDSVKVPSLILVHRRELATQAVNRLREFGVPHGLILAGEPTTPYARVQVAGVQTLVKRTAPPARLVIADEAHLSTAATWRSVLDQYPDALILGVTATPWRLSGKPLAGQYDRTIVGATPAQLRDLGFLCPVTGFSFKSPDMSTIGKVGDEYNQGQAGEAMSAIVPTVVAEWKAHAAHLSTIVFATTVEHSQKLTAEFRAAGVRAEHLDGTTPIDARRAILARVDRGETQVLCNVGVAVEGLDIPRLKCCVLARPTMSTARALQMIGRVRRPWQGVTARIHDHAFVIAQHGLPDAERDYQIHAEPTKDDAPASLSTCPKCFAIFVGRVCSECGVKRPPTERELREILDAEKFVFGEGTESVPADGAETEPQAKRQVNVAWDNASRGRVLEGRFVRSFEEDTQWGKRRIYVIDSARYLYALPGTAMLDRLWNAARVVEGDAVRVSYVADEVFGTKSRKVFRLEIDRAARGAA